MKVRDVMTRNTRTCRPEDTLDAVGERMILVDCGVLPVVTEGKVVGMITDRDVCLKLTRSDRRPSDVAVEEVMSLDVAVCHADDDVRAALLTMRRRGVRRLPVVGSGNELLGLLSLDDIAVRSTALTNGPQGPFYAEIGETLKAINQRPETPRPKKSPRGRRLAVADPLRSPPNG